MKAYIINLNRSVDRRLYMSKQLMRFPYISAEFITAVDGYSLSAKERVSSFDDLRFKSRNEASARPGEVGCTLSHQKCYRKIIDENEPYVLILEDDIYISNTIAIIIEKVSNLMQTNVPRIILLSDFFWYTKTAPLIGKYKLATVYNAFLTHSYIINQAAARLMIEERPYIIADDWIYIRKKGIKLNAILPHLASQKNNGTLPTTVNLNPVGRKSIKWQILHFRRLLTMKFLLLLGHFEKA